MECGSDCALGLGECQRAASSVPQVTTKTQDSDAAADAEKIAKLKLHGKCKSV